MRMILPRATVFLAVFWLGGPGLAEEPAEKLLWGFEKAAFESKKIPIVEKDGDFEVTLASRPMSGFTAEYKIRIAKGAATEGEYALRRLYTGDGLSSKLANYTNLYRMSAYSDVLNTFQYFGEYLPLDWSGYDLFRVDVQVRKVPVTLRVSLEDEDLILPVDRFFNVPADQWVTLEIDLTRAAEARGFDPSHVANLFIVPEPGKPFPKEISVDNLRLCKRGAASKLPVVIDQQPYEMGKPRLSGINQKNAPDKLNAWEPVAEVMPPVLAREGKSPPVAKGLFQIDFPPGWNGYERCGDGKWHRHLRIVAADDQRMLVGFGPKGTVDGQGFSYNGHGHLTVMQTLDGGKIWKGIGGTDLPTLAARWSVGGAAGIAENDIMVYDNLGCSVLTGWYGYPSDRLFFRRIAFNGREWTLTPHYWVTSESRHCVHFARAIRLPSGRIWMGWAQDGRDGYQEVAAMYSDDHGSTWHPWHGDDRKSSRVPGFFPERKHGEYRTTAMKQEELEKLRVEFLELVCYQGQPALFANGKWTVFDGKAWRAPQSAPSPLWNEPFVVDGVLYLFQRTGGLHAWTGAEWKQERVLDRNGSFSSVGKTLVYVAPEQKNRELLKNIVMWRKTGGAWSGPERLLDKDEDAPIAHVATPLVSPEGFVPVAYMCTGRNWVKVLKMPVVPAAEKQ